MQRDDVTSGGITPLEPRPVARLADFPSHLTQGWHVGAGM